MRPVGFFYQPVLRGKWFIVMSVVFAAIWIELVEHRPDLYGFGTMLDVDLLMYGLIVPLLIGVVLAQAHAMFGYQVWTQSVGAALNMKAKPRRVMVVNNQALLSAGIINLLAAEQGLSVETVSMQDEASLTQAIRGAMPDVVIMDEDIPLNVLLAVFGALNDRAASRVVLVSADSNRVVVYLQGQMRVASVRDLVDILKTG